MPDRVTEPPDFPEFRAFAAALGNDALCAQGAGGNVSLKHDDAMWVKASGAWLKDAVARNIFVVIDQPEPDQATEPVYRRLDNDVALRPSIETSLHVTLPHRIVVHVHAVAALALAVRLEAATLFNEKLVGRRFAFIPYTKPGWPLTQVLRRVLLPVAPDIFVLGNHGLIVGGETVAEVGVLLADINARLEAPMRNAPPPDLRFLQEACGTNWRLPQSTGLHSLATDAVSRGYATGGTLYPDHAVFLGRGCRAVAGDEIADVDPAKHPMILIEGKGVLLAAGLSPAGEAMAECLTAVLARIPPGVQLHYLTSRDEDELLNWDAEKYRQASI